MNNNKVHYFSKLFLFMLFFSIILGLTIEGLCQKF